MKIYFTAATVGVSEKHKKNYKLIVNVLKELGHRVRAEHIFGKYADKLVVKGDEASDETIALHRKMVTWKHQADIIVVEASNMSFAVGQEISYAVNNNKPVIALYHKGRRPDILEGVGTEYIHVVEYSSETLKKALKDYIEYAKDTVDTRFNFFISSRIEAFLDWISKERKVPRAVFLRQLIEEDMGKNKRYLKEVGRK